MQTETKAPRVFQFDTKPHILVVEARFHAAVADSLFDGAKAVLDACGATYDRLPVPGVFEVPAAITCAVKGLDFDPVRRRYDGYIALGCVIKGETNHDDIIGRESARGLQDLALRYVLAVGNGILTVNTMEQALERAKPEAMNRGGAAAEACLRMLEIKHQFHLTSKRRWVAKSS